jgi:CheY-like chemotaxis protein/tetratricopeptide (TPR) repeat protein
LVLRFFLETNKEAGFRDVAWLLVDRAAQPAPAGANFWPSIQKGRPHMNLQSQLAALQQQTRGLSLVERAKLCCGLAKQLEKAGEYEAACEALEEFWPERNESPKLEGLDELTKAEVLLRIGALAGWVGSADQTGGSQESAKNLITQSVEIYDGLGQSERVAEARGDLALCYWREGAYDEARIHLANAISFLGNENSELKAVLLIRAGIVEVWAQRLSEALRLYNQAAPLLEGSEDHGLKGALHNEFALLFNRFGLGDNRNDYLDRALIEYAAAGFHFEEAGHTRYQASVENNLGFLFFTLGIFSDAHKHLNRAGHLFRELGDNVHLAQVEDTRARTLLAEGRYVQAERVARLSVRIFERGGEQALLAEALTTQGVVVARLGRYSRSKELLDRAVEVAETAGDLEGAGRAKLSIIEELAEQTPHNELASIYESGAELLLRSQDPSSSRRLIACAGRVIEALAAAERKDQRPNERTWEGFSLKREILKYEAALIERALRDAGGSVTKAARLLGMRHQSLIYLIKARHRGLLERRSVVRKRRHRIVAEAKRLKGQSPSAVSERGPAQISILHVEDNEMVAKLVQEMLTTEEMHVDPCASGTTALKILKSDARYDLIIVDNDLPGIGGLELIRRARGMGTRRRTPIIMLSGDDCEKEAWRARVSAFLRKPEDIDKVSSTVARLLEEANSLKTRNRTDIR